MESFWVSYYFDNSREDFFIDGIFSLENDAIEAVEKIKARQDKFVDACGHINFPRQRIQDWLIEERLRGFNVSIDLKSK